MKILLIALGVVLFIKFCIGLVDEIFRDFEVFDK